MPDRRVSNGYNLFRNVHVAEFSACIFWTRQPLKLQRFKALSTDFGSVKFFVQHIRITAGHGCKLNADCEPSSI